MPDLDVSQRTQVLGFLRQRPLAVETRYLGAILSMAHGLDVRAAAQALERKAVPSVAGGDGVAIIPVLGAITHRANCLSEFLGLASVEGIREQFRAALNNPDVGAIAFVMDSPGGEVAGIADLADEIRAARGRKPMTAIVDEGMYSAAYWIGAATDRVVLTQTAGVGSIGVLAVHVDESGMYERAGAKVTVVKSGKKKAQFNGMEPLSEEARADLDAEINRLAEMFFSAVAASRPDLDAETLRGFEGQTFSGKQAVKLGLADAVMTADEALQQVQRDARRNARAAGTAPGKGKAMSAGNGGDGAGALDPEKVIEIETAAAKRAAEGERKRVSAISDIVAAASFGANAEQSKKLTALRDEVIKSGASVEDVAARVTDLRASFQSSDEIDGTQRGQKQTGSSMPPAPEPRSREEMIGSINDVHHGALARVAG